MASKYDPAKKCRVGTMDEAQFYSECDSDNGDYFRRLVGAWTKAGGTLKWGAGGVGLRGQVSRKDSGICFLAPKYAGKPDRIELACVALGKQIGADRNEALVTALRAAAGESVLGKTMVCVTRPGALTAAGQMALTQTFVGLLAKP